MWAVCNEDGECLFPFLNTLECLLPTESRVDPLIASILTAEIGYGNAAGLLFRKGMSGPPPARIEELRDTNPTASERNPITSLQADPEEPPSDASPSMTLAEKERETERLLTLFDRMDRNKVMSAQTGNGERKGMKEVMEDQMRSGAFREKEEKMEEEEEKRRQEEEEREEEEAMRDLREYQKMMGKK